MPPTRSGRQQEPSPHIPPEAEHALEEQRALLRHALSSDLMSAALRDALRRRLNPAYLQQAATRGVFIAYARSDELFALDLTTKLRDGGLNVWLDELEVTRDGDWYEEEQRALKQTGLMIVVITPDGLKDSDVLRQVRAYVELGKLVLGALVETCDPSMLGLLMPPFECRSNPQEGIEKIAALLSPFGAKTGKLNDAQT